MESITCVQHIAQLDSVMRRVQRLRLLDPSAASDVQQALEESHRLLGVLAWYRHWLQSLDQQRALQRRCAHPT